MARKLASQIVLEHMLERQQCYLRKHLTLDISVIHTRKIYQPIAEVWEELDEGLEAS